MSRPLRPDRWRGEAALRPHPRVRVAGLPVRQVPGARRHARDLPRRRPGRSMKRAPIMVLAHNEERHIEACLKSIFAADPEVAFDVYVMANGCTDATEEIVRQYA